MSTALVTGTTRGLGRALPDRLHADGWEVRTLTRDQVDLANLDAIPAAVASAIRGLHRLDLVLLCAGILGGLRDLKDQTINQLREVTDVSERQSDTYASGQLHLYQNIRSGVFIINSYASERLLNNSFPGP